MSNPYSKFQTDSDAEKNGVWVDYGDFQVKLARAGRTNKPFQRMLENKTRKYRRQLQTNTADPAVMEAVVLECVSKTVVTGWRTRLNGEWYDGKLMPPEGGELVDATPDAILAVLKAIPDLADAIQEAASDFSTFRAIEQEEDAGN